MTLTEPRKNASIPKRRERGDKRYASARQAPGDRAHKRVRGRPFESKSAREAARLSAESRRGRRASSETDSPTDAAIEANLRRIASGKGAGAVQAAKELRERARVLPPSTKEGRAHEKPVLMEELSDEELERLRQRLLSMAWRAEQRAARRSSSPSVGGDPAPPRASESRR
jgi:hypothetical protein